jgi:hypothetical protein
VRTRKNPGPADDAVAAVLGLDGVAVTGLLEKALSPTLGLLVALYSQADAFTNHGKLLSEP